MAPKFLTEYNILEGSPRKTVKNLEDLSEEEMWELTERVIAYLATEFNIEIKDKSNYYIK
jgi:diadenosine tetraphosphate (Ap4A) HIT family hydrolase